MIRLAALLCCVICGAAGALHAAEAKVETVVEGLNTPTGIAIQPETNQVFVAESGAQRVVRIVDGKTSEVVTGFAKEAKALADAHDIGPLGLGFLDKETLVVGEGGQAAGKDSLLVFKLPAAGDKPVTVEEAKFALPLPAIEMAAAEGNFYGVAVTKSGIYVTSTRDSAQGSVNKADVNGTKVENLRRWIVAQEVPGLAAPLGITVSPRGEVVVGHNGKADVAGDGLLAFYSARDGRLLASFPTTISDVSALAYSPSGQLYALDVAWNNAGEGGLYQLIAARDGNSLGVKAEKIASLAHPTAMAFASDGTLYVTTIGGKLLKVIVP